MAYKNLELELDDLLTHVIEAGASDLHLIAGQPPVMRVDSKLMIVKDKNTLTSDQIEQYAKLMLSDSRQKILQKEKDLDFSYEVKDGRRFRINAFYQQGVLSMALRYIPKNIQTLDELNLPPILAEFTNRKQGLVLVVGPTGHGKSTTLASLINHINKERTEHIITIEDPIEFIYTNKKSMVQQREVGEDTGSFATAIRATLREDANVILVGEMRDPESISSTITVAETGHLVFTTLHTNDIPQTIDRIIDTFPSHQQQQIRNQLAAILTGIVSMRLVNKIGGGRLPVIETLKTNEAVRNLIRENKTYELINVIHTGASQNMISLEHSLANLVNKSEITLEEANKYVRYPDIFESQINKNNLQ